MSHFNSLTIADHWTIQSIQLRPASLVQGNIAAVPLIWWFLRHDLMAFAFPWRDLFPLRT